MVFCYQNCSDLLWEKNVLVIEKNFWNSRLKAENLQNFWDHLNNLFKQWKVRTISGNRMLFLLVPYIFYGENCCKKLWQNKKTLIFVGLFFSWKCSTYYKVVRFTCNFFEIWIFRQICWFNLLREICFYISHFEIESLW